MNNESQQTHLAAINLDTNQDLQIQNQADQHTVEPHPVTEH